MMSGRKLFGFNKKRKIFSKVILIFSLFVFVLGGCGQLKKEGNIQKVGLLVSGTISDQAWGTKGYRGLLDIQSTLNVDVYYKEHIDTYKVTERAVAEYEKKGINLIFGHGREFAPFFDELAKKYPSVHFIAFNGQGASPTKNTTHIELDTYAMGFFGGVLAGKMTKTNKVGIVAAFEWQKEIEGFQDGVRYANEEVVLLTKYVGDWNNREKALQLLEEELKENVDIVYPAGDEFQVEIVENMKEKGLYAIGYISEQSDLGKYTVLTSTILDIPSLYVDIATAYHEGKLEAGNLSSETEEHLLSLGQYSPKVGIDIKSEMEEYMKHYQETGNLPNK